MQHISNYFVGVGTSDSNSNRLNHRVRSVNSIAMAIVIFLTVVLTIAQIQCGFKKEFLIIVVFFIIPITTITLNVVKRATLSNYFISFSVPLININELGLVSNDDRRWFASNLLTEIIKRGCNTMIIFKNERDGRDFAYWQNMLEMSNKMGVVLNMFFDYNQAIEFLREKEMKMGNTRFE